MEQTGLGGRIKAADKEGMVAGLGDKFQDQEFKPQVLTEQVARILTEMILDGTLGPDEQLVETQLQQHLGISRSPLREAFRDLEKRGLVTIVPRKGTFVKKITSKDIEENFPVRAVLEGLAAREAYPLLTKNDLADMEKALAGMKKAGEAGNSQGYRENHNDFHEIFIRACGNQLLIDMLSTLRMHRIWYLVSYRYHRMGFQMALDVHARILELFSSPDTDPEELEFVVRNHIEEALARLFRTSESSEKQLEEG